MKVSQTWHYALRVFTVTLTPEMFHTDCSGGPQFIFILPQRHSILKIGLK